MTPERLIEIKSLQPEEAVKALQISSFVIPKWADLQKEYDPTQHKIFDTAIYPPKLNETGQDDFKRVALPLQKLAVDRIAQAMFATPVERIYTYDKESESEQMAVDILEQVYRVDNNIDSENLERAKKNNACCQVVTIWSVYEKPYLVKKEPSKYRLTHNSYSEKDGYQIFAINDEYNNILVVSLLYKDLEGTQYFDVYMNGEKPEFRRYMKLDNWVIDTNVSKPLDIFPVVYAHLEEPVWGGETGTAMVENMEEMEAFQGLYVKRNALPTFTLDYGDIAGGNPSNSEENSNDSRRIIKVGKGGQMQDVTWEGAGESVESRFARLRNAFFESCQMPDISFANLINSNTSAENKELLFSDSKAKARDLGGEWEKVFYDELEIVKGFCKVMFPSYAEAYDNMVIRSSIKPYTIKSRKENSEYIATATEALSLPTKVRILGEVDDINAEVEAIQEDLSRMANQGE